MILLKLFPNKRNVLIEKTNILKTNKNFYLLSFNSEKFIVRLNSEINYYIHESLLGDRQIWNNIDIDVLECQTDGEGKKLIAWINKFITERNISGEAKNIKIIQLTNNFMKTKRSWMLYGCTLEGVFLNNDIKLIINPNFCAETKLVTIKP